MINKNILFTNRTILYSFFYIVFFILYYKIFIVVNTPLILADEAGYISNARYFATANGLVDLRDTIYYPGVSLFYAIAFYFTDNFNMVYKVIQIINLIFAILIPIIVFNILKKINTHNISSNILFYLSFIYFLYPTVSIYVNLALPEVLLTLLYLIIIYSLLNLESKITFKYSFLLMVSLILLFLSHPRTVVILIALLFFSIGLYRRNKKYFLFFISSIIFIYFMDMFFIKYLQNIYLSIILDDRENRPKHIISIASLLHKNFSSLDVIKSLTIEILGQLWYLTIVSFGMIWFGIISLIKSVMLHKYRYTSLFVIMSSLGMLLLSSLFMNGGPRGDHHIYGRYNEFIWLFVFMIGLYSYYNQKFTKKILIYYYSFFTVLIISYMIIDGKELVNNLHFNSNNISGIYLYNYVFNGYNIYYISFTFLIFCFLIFFLKLKKILFLGLVAFYLLLNNIFIVKEYYNKDSIGRMHEHELSKVINKIIHKKVIVGYDLETFNGWHYFNYQIYSPNIQMHRFFLKNLKKDNFEYVISGKFNIGNKFILVGLENHHKQNLFISKNSNYYKSFVQNGYLLPSNFPTKLPDEAFKYKFDNIYIKNNYLKFSIQHIGHKSFWPNLYGVKKAKYSVRIGIQYLDKNKRKLFEGRKELPGSIYPGGHQSIEMQLPKICKSKILKIDLIQESVTWFEKYGNRPIYFECNNGIYKEINK